MILENILNTVSNNMTGPIMMRHFHSGTLTIPFWMKFRKTSNPKIFVAFFGNFEGNELSKLRRHASRVHFAKIHFGKIHLKINTLLENTLLEIHF